jgi:hypothetical protein
MRSKRRIGRKRRTLKMRTMKFRGGNFDDPDIKDFMNSKIEALEQKITELENNIPVRIGFRITPNGRENIFVEKNISLGDFFSTIHGNNNSNNYNKLSLPKVYSLPNVRGTAFNTRFFSAIDKDDDALLKSHDLKGLQAKYPGMFTDISE